MASIERLSKGRWRARWRDPSGRQKAKTFTHKNLADKYLQGVGMAMQASTYVDPSAGNMSVKVFAAKWISACGQCWGQREGSPADAWARERGDDPRRVLRSVRRRPRRGRRKAGLWVSCVLDVY
jgi:hypothetical protein